MHTCFLHAPPLVKGHSVQEEVEQTQLGAGGRREAVGCQHTTQLLLKQQQLINQVSQERVLGTQLLQITLQFGSHLLKNTTAKLNLRTK